MISTEELAEGWGLWKRALKDEVELGDSTTASVMLGEELCDSTRREVELLGSGVLMNEALILEDPAKLKLGDPVGDSDCTSLSEPPVEGNPEDLWLGGSV
jgi:hypothetical protein